MSSAFGPATLGELIDQLDGIPDLGTKGVHFDWCRLAPLLPQSYRGYYEHLALGISLGYTCLPSGTEFRRWLMDAIGRDYEGYKGGAYTMTRETPIWVSAWGQASEYGVVACVDVGHGIELRTEKFES